mgnify:FL=1
MQRILGLLNQSNSLEHIVRLSNIETEDDLNRCIADQYAVAFTKAQWVERFPKIPPENVVCAQGTLNVNGLMYYDPKHGICFPLHLFGNSLLFDKTDDDFQRRTCSMISELERCHADRDYRRLLQPVVSEGTGKIVMQLLLDLLNADEPNSKLYTTIIHEYSFCDGGAGVLANSPDFAEKMMRCKSRQQKASTRKKLKGFPDVIPVYRGEGSESTPYTKAFSWTTEINTAYFFASRLGGERSRVVNGFVKKEDVLEYLADRNESEIIVFPDKVQDITVCDCYTLDEFASNIKKPMDGYRNTGISRVTAADLFSEVHSAYCDLPDSCDHDNTHALRVALMAMFLYRVRVLSRYTGKDTPLGRRKNVAEICKSLLFAAAWHDTGRTSDFESPDHGARSAGLFENSYGLDDVARFLMTYHCRSDEEAKAYLDEHADPALRNDIWEAYMVLKDADALDRWRFGTLSSDFINVSMLHFEESKRLMPVAAVLQTVQLT